jgi:hypothetical protein
VPAKKGLPTNPPPTGQGSRKDQVHLVSRCTGGSGSIVGSSDLTQDFGFTQDLRIQSSADFEKVAHGCQAMFHH